MEVLTSVMRSCEIKLRITKKKMSIKLAPSCLPHPSHNLTSLSERKMGSSSASFAQKTLFWKRTTFCYLLDQVIEWMDVMKIVALSLSFVSLSLSLLYLPSILPEKRLLPSFPWWTERFVFDQGFCTFLLWQDSGRRRKRKRWRSRIKWWGTFFPS